MHKHHHRFLIFSLLAMVIGGVLAAGSYWAYFNFWARFRPVTLTRNQAAIESLLNQADWVSPGNSGPVLWVVTFRDCQACTSYQREEFPKLAAKGVDTRVIVFARADRDGTQQSTPAERATVAELWINRDWNLYGRWMATARRDWTGDGLKPAERDWARRAVVNSTRDYVNQLIPLVRTSGLADAYPLLIWRDREGALKACSCTDSRSYHFIRSDLGIDKPLLALPAIDIPWLSNLAERNQSDVAPQIAPAAPAPAPSSAPGPAVTPQSGPQSGPQATPQSGPQSAPQPAPQPAPAGGDSPAAAIGPSPVTALPAQALARAARSVSADQPAAAIAAPGGPAQHVARAPRPHLRAPHATPNGENVFW